MKHTSIAIVDPKGKIVFETECETDPKMSDGICLGTVSRKLFPEKVRTSIKAYEARFQSSIGESLKTYEETCLNVDKLEKEGHIKNEPLIALLESIPGAGPITAMTFEKEFAYLGD